MERKLIIFIDSGDTLVDEGSEYRKKGSQIVEHAGLVDGAEEVLRELKKRGFVIELVADGLVESFDNVYRQHGLEDIFAVRTISEEVGEEKPAPVMFQTAMDRLGLKEEDKKRVIMVGNNLKRDITGANCFGITSVLVTWSPRYRMMPENVEEIPDYTILSIRELVELAERCDERLSGK